MKGHLQMFYIILLKIHLFLVSYLFSNLFIASVIEFSCIGSIKLDASSTVTLSSLRLLKINKNLVLFVLLLPVPSLYIAVHNIPPKYLILFWDLFRFYLYSHFLF